MEQIFKNEEKDTIKYKEEIRQIGIGLVKKGLYCI